MTRLPAAAPSRILPSPSTSAGLHAEEGQRRRAGLLVDGAGQRRDHDAAGLRLPPGVDDRAAAVADDAVIPLPGFRIDRLADRAEEPQRFPRGLLHVLLAGAHQRADRGRRGVEDVDAVLVDHLPEARGGRDSSARPRTSASSRRWRAARRRCSCGRSPSRHRRCTSRCRRHGSRRRIGASSRRRRDSRRSCAARPSASRSSPTCRG